MEHQLVSFGNYLLKTYGVDVHSNDGKNTPIYQREVTDADLRNWEDEVGVTCIHKDHTDYPSRHALNEVVLLSFKESMEAMNATVIGIHFYQGKVKYDLSLWLGDGNSSDPVLSTRVYNVDSCFITPRPPIE